MDEGEVPQKVDIAPERLAALAERFRRPCHAGLPRSFRMDSRGGIVLYHYLRVQVSAASMRGHLMEDAALAALDGVIRAYISDNGAGAVEWRRAPEVEMSVLPEDETRRCAIATCRLAVVSDTPDDVLEKEAA